MKTKKKNKDTNSKQDTPDCSLCKEPEPATHIWTDTMDNNSRDYLVCDYHDDYLDRKGYAALGYQSQRLDTFKVYAS